MNFFFFPDGTRQAARKSARGQHRYALAQRFVMGEHSLWTCRSQHVTLTAACQALAKAEHVLTDSGYRITELMVVEASEQSSHSCLRWHTAANAQAIATA